MHINLKKPDDDGKVKRLRNYYELNDDRLSYADVVRKAIDEALERAKQHEQLSKHS